jgi:hypothetical protein
VKTGAFFFGGQQAEIVGRRRTAPRLKFAVSLVFQIVILSEAKNPREITQVERLPVLPDSSLLSE